MIPTFKDSTGRPLRRCLIAFAVGVLGSALPVAGQGAATPRPAGGVTAGRLPLTPIDPSKMWTLESALARAMEANPDLVSAKFDFERQEGIRIQLRARVLPNISVSASTNERERDLVDLSAAQRQAPATADNAVALYSYDARVEIRQLVFDGFNAWNQLKRQQLLSSQSYQNLRSGVLRIATTVRQSFDAIQLRSVLLAAEQQRVEEFAQIVKWTQQKLTVGEVAEFELLRAQSEYEGARADVAEAARALGQSEQVFRRLLQIPDFTATLKLDGKFEPRRFELPLDQALAQARKNRPDVQALALAVEAARRNEYSQYGSLVPRVDAFASYGMRSSYFNSGIRLEGWSYGVQGQWNIFDGGGAHGRIVTARAERRIADAKLAESQHLVTSRLQELYQGLEHARVAMEAQDKSLNLSTRAARDSKRSYEVGQANLEQVLQTEIGLRRVQSRYNEAIYNFNSLVAEVEFAIGGQLVDSVGLPETWKP